MTGFYIGKVQQEKRFAEHMVGQLATSTGVLLHLEHDKPQFAKNLLVVGIEGQILILSELESEHMDDASKDLRGRVLKRFSEVRRAYPSNESEGIKNIDQIVEKYIAEFEAKIK